MNRTITKIVLFVLCAMEFGLEFSLFGHISVLGYIIAGILLGSSNFQFIIDREAIAVFYEMKILFLFFVIELGLSFEKNCNIWKNSIVTTLISMMLIYGDIERSIFF